VQQLWPIAADVSVWAYCIAAYIALAGISFIPALAALLKKIELKPGGPSFEETNFSEENKRKLAASLRAYQRHSRILEEQGQMVRILSLLLRLLVDRFGDDYALPCSSN
jgi:hypothetical protein